MYSQTKRMLVPYHTKHTGIVLRHIRKKYLLALLDESAGRIDVRYFGNELSAGTVIQYGLAKQGNGYALSDVQLHTMPFSLAKKDVLFLHHALEVCFYFIPVGSCTNGIFDVLRFLYDADHAQWNSLFKKIFMFKLFITIGHYPDSSIMHNAQVCLIMHKTLHEIPYDIVSASLEQDLSRWLQQCIAQHPAIEYFNTVQFLTMH